MPNSIVAPRKQRTRQHVIADLSVHFVEGIILQEGHTVHRLSSEYSYDFIMNTFDEHGYAEPGPIYFQLKSSETLHQVGEDFVFDIDIRDYNLWIHEEVPVILVLFDVICRKGYWICLQNYFGDDANRHPDRAKKSVRIRIPKTQRINRLSVRRIRQIKCAGKIQVARLFK